MIAQEIRDLPDSPESARLPKEVPPEAESFAREATVALAGKRADAKIALSDKEIEIVLALAEALVPASVRARTGGARVDMPASLLDLIGGWRVEYRLALRASLRFIEYAPILFQIKPKAAKLPLTPFTGLPPEDRERVCRRLDEAHGYNVRSLFKIAKTLVYGVYYSHRDVESTVGYDASANKLAAEAWAREQGR
jgi:hypothetical protein